MLDLTYFSTTWLIFAIGYVACQSRSHLNPTILQDSRLEPTVDGTFGFRYKTEDGISHAAQGDPTGFIQGSYSYKDPTGLKVNFNYFAGSRNNNRNTATSKPQPQYNPPQSQYNSYPEPQYEPEQSYYSEPESYQSPEKYRPRTRPRPLTYMRDQYQPNYITYPNSRLNNEVYDGDNYQYREGKS